MARMFNSSTESSRVLLAVSTQCTRGKRGREREGEGIVFVIIIQWVGAREGERDGEVSALVIIIQWVVSPYKTLTAMSVRARFSRAFILLKRF